MLDPPWSDQPVQYWVFRSLSMNFIMLLTERFCLLLSKWMVRTSEDFVGKYFVSQSAEIYIHDYQFTIKLQIIFSSVNCNFAHW